MIKDGLMDRFGIEQVYGMHNEPRHSDRPVRDPHRPDHGGNRPDRHQDRGPRRPRGTAAQMHQFRFGRCAGISGLQSIVSRTIDPLESAVISICEFHAGNARNVIPQTAELARHHHAR